MADLSKLTALVAAAKATVATKAAVKTAESRVKTALTAIEREDAQAEASALQASLDWTTTSLVAVFDQWKCDCGQHGRSPQGMFLFQEHARSLTTTRLIRVVPDATHSDLPKRIKLEHRSVQFCIECSFDAGFIKIHDRQLEGIERRAALKRPGLYQTEWENLRRQREGEQL